MDRSYKSQLRQEIHAEPIHNVSFSANQSGFDTIETGLFYLKTNSVQFLVQFCYQSIK